MSITLWSGLEDLNFLVGADFPAADEDALWRCAQVWAGAAAELRELTPEAVAAGTHVVEALSGGAGDAFAELWLRFAAEDGLVEQLAMACDQMAAACDTAAVEVEYAKIQYIAALIVLGITLAALAAAIWAGGVSALGMPAAIAAAQITIRLVLVRLLTAIAVGASLNVAIDGVAQAIQTGKAGHRDEWDWAKTWRAAEDGAIFGAAGGGAFLAGGRLAPGLMRTPVGLLGAGGLAGGVGGFVAPAVHGEMPTGRDFVMALTSGIAGALGPDLARGQAGTPDLSRLTALAPDGLDLTPDLFGQYTPDPTLRPGEGATVAPHLDAVSSGLSGADLDSAGVRSGPEGLNAGPEGGRASPGGVNASPEGGRANPEGLNAGPEGRLGSGDTGQFASPARTGALVGDSTGFGDLTSSADEGGVLAGGTADAMPLAAHGATTTAGVPGDPLGRPTGAVADSQAPPAPSNPAGPSGSSGSPTAVVAAAPGSATIAAPHPAQPHLPPPHPAPPHPRPASPLDRLSVGDPAATAPVTAPVGGEPALGTPPVAGSAPESAGAGSERDGSAETYGPDTGIASGHITDEYAVEVVRRTVFDTDAGLAFYSPDDDIREFARAVHPADGYVTLDLHGSPEGFYIDDYLLTPEQFALALRDLRATGTVNLPEAVNIKLLSCDTAVGGANSPAARLAQALGVEVIAPDQPVWTTLDGDEVVASPVLVDGMIIPADPPDGSWHHFAASGEDVQSWAGRGATVDSGPEPVDEAAARGSDIAWDATDLDPIRLVGSDPRELMASIPGHWVRLPSRSGAGTVFADPDHRGRQIRIMPGYPDGNRPDALTHGPYAEFSQNGVRVKVPLLGNPMLGDE